MSDFTGSFTVSPILTATVAGAKTTFSEFASSFAFASQYVGHTNSLVLSVTTPGTLSLSVDTPGVLDS